MPHILYREQKRTGDDRPGQQPRSVVRQLFGAHGRPGRLRGARPVRRRVSPRSRLARRRHAVRVRAAAGARYRRHGAGHASTTVPPRCSTALGRARRGCASTSSRSWRSRGSGAASTTSSSRRAPSTRSNWSPRSSSTPATSCSPKAPSYVTALVVFKSFQAQVEHVETDENGLIPESLREHIAAAQGRGQANQVPLHGADVQQPVGRDAVLGAPARDPRDRALERHPRSRGQPVRAAVLRRRAAACHAVGRGGWRDLPRHLLEDARTRIPGRLGARASRYSRKTHSCERGRGALPELVHPA